MIPVFIKYVEFRNDKIKFKIQEENMFYLEYIYINTVNWCLGVKTKHPTIWKFLLP